MACLCVVLLGIHTLACLLMEGNSIAVEGFFVISFMAVTGTIVPVPAGSSTCVSSYTCRAPVRHQPFGPVEQ